MKKVTANELMKTLSDYIYSEVPLNDFDTADELKESLMEMLEAMVDKVVEENFEFEEEEDDEEDAE